MFGLQGPNSAGKTTAIRVVMTLLPPNAGTMEVFGLDTPGGRRCGSVGWSARSPSSCRSTASSQATTAPTTTGPATSSAEVRIAPNAASAPLTSRPRSGASPRPTSRDAEQTNGPR